MLQKANLGGVILDFENGNIFNETTNCTDDQFLGIS